MVLELSSDGRRSIDHEGRGNDAEVDVSEDGQDEGLGLTVEEGQVVGGYHDQSEEKEEAKGV